MACCGITNQALRIVCDPRSLSCILINASVEKRFLPDTTLRAPGGAMAAARKCTPFFPRCSTLAATGSLICTPRSQSLSTTIMVTNCGQKNGSGHFPPADGELQSSAFDLRQEYKRFPPTPFSCSNTRHRGLPNPFCGCDPIATGTARRPSRFLRTHPAPAHSKIRANSSFRAGRNGSLFIAVHIRRGDVGKSIV